jgi:inosine/xanthosine triphosphate pyrophosphatase family protein
MWNELGTKFLNETHAKNRPCRAKAVVAYCDGQKILTFVGETSGTIAESPRGNRDFYWDTVFIPDPGNTTIRGKTYAEIVDDPGLGLEAKVVHFSQSSRAMLRFLEYRFHNPPALWPGE